MTEKFISLQITTERDEVERTCAALEALSIPVVVQHIAFADVANTNETLPGYRILTRQSSEQQARAIVGRTIAGRSGLASAA